MEESKNFLLSLVRMALWKNQEHLPEFMPDWNKVISLAKKQTLVGLVADVVPLLPEHLQPDQNTKVKLHVTAFRIMSSHSLLNRKLVEVKERMDANGIHTVLFKGQGVALNYPNPLSRQCGDIDLYVGEENFMKVMKILAPTSEKDADYYKYLKHFNVDEDGVHIEIHRIAEILPGFRQDRLFQKWTVESLVKGTVREVEIGGGKINLPSADFDAIYIMNHAWHHFINGGIGLRQLCDWTMHMHRFHKELDEKKLRENLKAFGLVEAWKVIAGVAVKYLGLPEEECLLFDRTYLGKSDKMLQVIWEEGNFGHHSTWSRMKRPEGHFAGKFHSFRKGTTRKMKIMSVSPAYVVQAWIYFFVNGMRHAFIRIG